MADHFTDSFSASYDEQHNVFIHRKDSADPTKNPLTFALKKFEVIVLLKSLCDKPDYKEEVVAYLNSIGAVHPTHPI